jgi:hypothetical protein
MRLYQEALEIKERLGDLLGKGDTLREMASILRLRGDLDGAMRLYQEALEIFERLGDLRDKAVTLGMMGQALWAQGKRGEAIASLWSGLELLCKPFPKSSRKPNRPWPPIWRAGAASWAPRPSTACGARSSGRSRRPGRSPRPLERLSAIP